MKPSQHTKELSFRYLASLTPTTATLLSSCSSIPSIQNGYAWKRIICNSASKDMNDTNLNFLTILSLKSELNSQFVVLILFCSYQAVFSGFPH